MFDVKELAGNTSYFEAYTHVGIYRLDEKRVVLIDSCDHKRMVKNLNSILEEKGFVVDTIINTHAHVDHICGNRFFQDKYGCRILSSCLEKSFISRPDMEPSFYDAGLTVYKKYNPLYNTDASVSEVITKENLPAGLEVISLPGHSFEMIGVRTDDDVLFLADSILSESTWENFRLPFFNNVNKAIETLKMIKGLEAKLFVPSHDIPRESITELADYNIEKLREKKRVVYELCHNQSFDDLFRLVTEDQEIEVRTAKYSMYAVMIRNLLTALVEDEKICSVYENGRMIYKIL